MKKLIGFIAILSLIFSASGCSGDKKVFEEYQKFENLSWNRFNILTFEVPIDDLQTGYNIYLNIRHIPEFTLANLHINFTYTMPSGDMRSTDKELRFFDNDGINKSNCLGDLCDIEFLLRNDLRMQEPGKLKVEIENKFSKLELPGIMEVGLIVKKHRKK
ncbi:MAG: gliding motility lipoprotein GldH [Bacteroidales bacterium]